MKYSILWLTTVTAVVAAIGTVALLGYLADFGGKNVPFVPVTVTYKDRTFEESGTREVELIRAIRGDGSTALIRHYAASDGSPQTMKVVTDVAAGTRTSVVSLTKSRTTFRMPETQAVAFRQARGVVCPEGKMVQIAGFDAVATEVTDSGPAAEYDLHITSYFAPELGCVPFGSLTKRVMPDGTERIIQEVQVLLVRTGQPDSSYYHTPDDYVELSPLERSIEIAKLQHLSPDEVNLEAAQMLEARYLEGMALAQP